MRFLRTPYVLLTATLLLLATPSWAKSPLSPTRWLAKHGQVNQRLETRLGAKSATFVDAVARAKIKNGSKKWLLRFAGQNPRALQAIAPLEKAHQMDKSGGMERFFRQYVERFAKTGPTPPKTADPKLVSKGAKVRNKLAKLARRQQLPALVVMVDGPDGAGKSSAIREVGKQLAGPYQIVDRVARLAAPDPSMPWERWVEKQLGITRGKPFLAPGQILFTDRSLLGNLVYGKDPAQAARAVAKLEKRLERDYGIKVLHVVARPSHERVTQTYGKRLAYQLYADQLSTPKPLVSERDVPAYQNLGKVTKGFEQAAQRFSQNSLLVDASDRKAYRRAVLDWIGAQAIQHAR